MICSGHANVMRGAARVAQRVQLFLTITEDIVVSSHKQYTSGLSKQINITAGRLIGKVSTLNCYTTRYITCSTEE